MFQAIFAYRCGTSQPPTFYKFLLESVCCVKMTLKSNFPPDQLRAVDVQHIFIYFTADAVDLYMHELFNLNFLVH